MAGMRTTPSSAQTKRRRAGLMLRALRERRLRESISRKARGASERDNGGSLGTGPLGVLKQAGMYALNMPWRLRSAPGAWLFEAAPKGSKAAVVLAHWAAHGPAHFPLQQFDRTGALRGLYRVLAYPEAYVTRLALGRRHLPPDDLAFLTACLVAERRFQRAPQAIPVIISDISLRRMVVAVGAALSGNRVLWWQIDYHMTTVMRLGFTDAVAMNGRGASAARDAACAVWALPAPTLTSITPVARIGTLGHAYNAIVKTDPVALAEQLRTASAADRILIRLHPRVSKPHPTTLPEGIEIRPREEALKDFCAIADVVVCGNSAVQLKIAVIGTPVIHMGEMDVGGTDTYGFVASEAILGSPFGKLPSIGDINRFYAQPAVQARISSLISYGGEAYEPLNFFGTQRAQGLAKSLADPAQEGGA